MTAFDQIIAARDGREAAPHVAAATLEDLEHAIKVLTTPGRYRSSIVMKCRTRANYLRMQPDMTRAAGAALDKL